MVEAQLEPAMNEFLKADKLEHLLKCFHWNAFLVLVALHFVADDEGAAGRLNARTPRHSGLAAWSFPSSIWERALRPIAQPLYSLRYCVQASLLKNFTQGDSSNR